MELFANDNLTDLLTGSSVGFAWQIDWCIGLQGQDAQFQFGDLFRQSPQAIEERTTVVEVISNEFAVGVETGAVATISDGEE